MNFLPQFPLPCFFVSSLGQRNTDTFGTQGRLKNSIHTIGLVQGKIYGWSPPYFMRKTHGFRWSKSLKPIQWYPSKRGFHKWGYPKIDDFEWTILFKWRIWEYCPFQKPPYYNIRHLTLMPQPPARRIFLDRLTSCKIRSFLWHERSFGREPWSSTLNPLSNEKRCAMFSGLFFGVSFGAWKILQNWDVDFPLWRSIPGICCFTWDIWNHCWRFHPWNTRKTLLMFRSYSDFGS